MIKAQPAEINAEGGEKKDLVIPRIQKHLKKQNRLVTELRKCTIQQMYCMCMEYEC